MPNEIYRVLHLVSTLFLFKEIEIVAKKIGNLIVEETITLEFCKEAIIEAAKHKHYRKSVRKVLSHIEDRAKELRDMIVKENYQMFRFVDRGLDFVGYRFFGDYTILRKRNLYNLYKSGVMQYR